MEEALYQKATSILAELLFVISTDAGTGVKQRLCAESWATTTLCGLQKIHILGECLIGISMRLPTYLVMVRKPPLLTVVALTQERNMHAQIPQGLVLCVQRLLQVYF